MADKNDVERLTPIIVAKGWAIIMVVYLVLFLGTGYIAFFTEDYSQGARMDPDIMNKFEGPELKAYVIEILKEETKVFAKKRELAGQSFNVVLGALLGFLSASATSYLGIRKMRPQTQNG